LSCSRAGLTVRLSRSVYVISVDCSFRLPVLYMDHCCLNQKDDDDIHTNTRAIGLWKYRALPLARAVKEKKIKENRTEPCGKPSRNVIIVAIFISHHIPHAGYRPSNLLKVPPDFLNSFKTFVIRFIEHRIEAHVPKIVVIHQFYYQQLIQMLT
jgi:hypothetical protein